MNAESKTTSIQISRTIAILSHLADNPAGLSIGEISELEDLSKSASHRIVGTLMHEGLVRQDRVTRNYALSLRFVSLAFRFLAGTGLREVCRPELEMLADQTGEFVRLAVADAGRLMFVAEAQGARRGLRYEGDQGRGQVRFHTNATGKAWLSTLPEDEAVRLVLEQGLDAPQDGPRAIRDIPALLVELSETRARGYAVAFDEGEAGVSAVAAAIPDQADGSPAVGAVAVVGPSVHLTPEKAAEVGPRLIASAARLSDAWPMGGVSAVAVESGRGSA